jgi:hypothetical protein
MNGHVLAIETARPVSELGSFRGRGEPAALLTLSEMVTIARVTCFLIAFAIFDRLMALPHNPADRSKVYATGR